MYFSRSAVNKSCSTIVPCWRWASRFRLSIQAHVSLMTMAAMILGGFRNAIGPSPRFSLKRGQAAAASSSSWVYTEIDWSWRRRWRKTTIIFGCAVGQRNITFVRRLVRTGDRRTGGRAMRIVVAGSRRRRRRASEWASMCTVCSGGARGRVAWSVGHAGLPDTGARGTDHRQLVHYHRICRQLQQRAVYSVGNVVGPRTPFPCSARFKPRFSAVRQLFSVGGRLPFVLRKIAEGLRFDSGQYGFFTVFARVFAVVATAENRGLRRISVKGV